MKIISFASLMLKIVTEAHVHYRSHIHSFSQELSTNTDDARLAEMETEPRSCSHEACTMRFY